MELRFTWHPDGSMSAVVNNGKLDIADPACKALFGVYPDDDRSSSGRRSSSGACPGCSTRRSDPRRARAPRVIRSAAASVASRTTIDREASDPRAPRVPALLPLRVHFKVIGAGDIDLEGSVSACVRARWASTPTKTSVRTTEGGRHQSVTVEPECPSARSVLDLYAALRALDGVMFL